METVKTGVRFRAVPDEALQEILPRWIGCQRVIYNSKVQEDKLFAAQRRLLLKENPSAEVKTPLDQQYSHFKDSELTPWLYEVPSVVLRNGAVRWFGAKQRQLKGLGKAPRMRNRNTFDSVFITNELFRFVELKDAKGRISHEIEIGTITKPLGRISFKARAKYGLPKSIIIRRCGTGEWWVSWNCEKEVDEVVRKPHELAYESWM